MFDGMKSQTSSRTAKADVISGQSNTSTVSKEYFRKIATTVTR